MLADGVMLRRALIVAHGQPSRPAEAAALLAAIARATATYADGWQVTSATMAEAGAVEAAVAQGRPDLILPFFMADGWFTRTALPARLGPPPLPRILPAFGLWPEVTALAARTLTAAAAARSWRVEDTRLVLAAHGSGRSPQPAAAARAMAGAISAALPFAEVRLGFLEETPGIEKAARGAGAQAICLPLFVARWGHVLTDLPRALDAAGFAGDRLSPLGSHADVPALLGRALIDPDAAPPSAGRPSAGRPSAG